LVDVIKRKIFGPSVYQGDLMMVLWIPARENDIGTPDFASVSNGKPKHPRVEILHLLKVMHVETDMAHA
jgi:hypothetical protein